MRPHHVLLERRQQHVCWILVMLDLLDGTVWRHDLRRHLLWLSLESWCRMVACIKAFLGILVQHQPSIFAWQVVSCLSSLRLVHTNVWHWQLIHLSILRRRAFEIMVENLISSHESSSFLVIHGEVLNFLSLLARQLINDRVGLKLNRPLIL